MYSLDQLYQALQNADAAGRRDDAMALTQEIQRQLAAQKAQSQTQAPEKPVTYTEALKGGAKRLAGSVQTAFGALTGDEEQAAAEGLARQQAITERGGVSLDKAKEAFGEGIIPGVKEVGRQIPYAIAEQLPNLAANIAGARIGATGGAMVGGVPGAVIGGLAGAFVPSMVTQAGSNIERQAQEGKPISTGSAFGAAVPQAALDVFADKTLFGRLMGIPPAKLGTEAAETIAKQSLKRTLATGTAKGVLAEVPTEVTQQMLERYQAGLSLTDEDARKEYLDTAYQTALLGPLGAVGQIQERSEARDTVAQAQEQQRRDAVEAQARAQRQATGVMEQQPLFTPEETPVPTAQPVAEVTPASPEAAPVTPTDGIPEPTLTIPEAEPEQMALFGPRGGVTPEAKASVELARQQGLPAEIEALLQTPDGRKQLAADMKYYFPEMTTKERNMARREIQQGTFRVEPTPVTEGTLTPELLKQFGITPRMGNFYKALVNANLANPMTYQLLVQAAETGQARGIGANKLLEAFPQYNPQQPQQDLFGGPANVTEAQPTQPDMFGFPQDGVRTEAEPTGAERGVEQPEAGQEVQPSALVPPAIQPEPKPTVKERIEQRKAEKAAAREQARAQKAQQAAAKALKAEPIEDTWINFDTGLDFNQLSPESKDRVIQYHNANALTQEIADEIAAIEKRNRRTEAANAAIKTESVEPEEAVSDMEFARGLPDIAEQSDQQTAETIRKGVEGKNLVQVARWIQENAPSKSYRVIARAVANRLERMSKLGAEFTFTVTEAKGKGLKAPLPAGSRGVNQVEYDKKEKINVRIQGNFTPEHGLRYSTVLHELVHTTTAAAVLLDTYRRKKKLPAVPGISEHVAQLNRMHDLVMSEIADRMDNPALLPDVVKAGLVGLEPTNARKQKMAQRLGVNQQNNLLKDTDELIAWGMTNPEFQAFLDQIQVPNTNKSFWSEFVNVIRSLLGLSAKQNSLLSEILSATEGLLNADVAKEKQGFAELREKLSSRQYQVDQQAQAQAQNLINSMSGTLIQTPRTPTPTPSQVVQNIVQTAVQNPSGAFSMIENGIAKVRTMVADKGAFVADQIRDFNDGAFYNVNGTIRADMLMSAEANTGNFIDAFFNFGGIDILNNGSIQVTDSQYSVDNIFKTAKQLAERIGTDTAKELITKAFYHYRAAAIKALPQDQWPENWKQDPRIVPTQQQIQAGLDAFAQVPELQEMRNQFIGSKNNIVQFLNKAGFLTDAKTKEYLADDSYAPWMRIKEYQDKAPGMGNIGRMVDLSQMKKLVGGTEEVNDMLENMAQMLAWGVRSGIKNHTANSALNTMEQMGTAVKASGRPGNVDPAHVVMTYVDGKPTYWRVDNPYDLAAFQSVRALDSAFMKEMAKWMGKLRAGIVLFPVFPIRQVIMDSQRAYMQAGVERPMAMVGKILKSFLSGEAYKEVSADAEALRKAGVAAQIDYNTYDNTRGLAERYGLKEREGGITNWWVNTPAYQALHKFAYSADLAVRLGIYRQTMEETGDQTLATSRAREIINFQKSGTSAAMISLKQAIPFLGAYMQGMDVLYRSMTGRGNSMKQRKAAAAAYWGNAAMYAGLVAAYAMTMSGDDEYEQQKGFVTDRNFLLPGGLLLPAPPESSFLPKVIVERITDYVLQESTDDPESAERLKQGIREAAFSSFLPPAAVYGVTPYIELKTNKSFFSDMPIVPEYYQTLKPSEQYTPRTSEFAKSVGQAANMSPIQIDYVLNAIGGTSAGALLQLADVVMGSEKTTPDKLPVVGTFQQKPVGGRYTEEYYAVRQLTTEAYNTVKLMAERGEEEKLSEYIAQPEIAARLAAREPVEYIHTLLNNVSEAKNAIDANKELSPDERRAMIDELNMQVERALKDMGIRKLRTQLE